MVKSNLKTIFTLTVIALLGVGVWSCKDDEEDNKGNSGNSGAGDETAVYVDLGLSSGTKWRSENEMNPADAKQGLYTFDDAYAAFGDKLPTKEQIEELVDECQWVWTGKGYNVDGPNGNSIYLPAAGVRNCEDSLGGVGVHGIYWSSMRDTNNSYSQTAWCGYYTYNNIYVKTRPCCYGGCVRLVQD